MLKELTPTQTMLNQIAIITGGPVDVSKVAIFETIVLNTQPVSKKGSLYEGAVATTGLLSDMAGFIKAGNSVPLHTQHLQGYELPVGKVFMADLNGSDELRALFYIPRDTEEGADFITKLNTSVIDEVSVGVMAAHLRCSQCGWDYLGPDATMMNLFDRTCGNDHVIGTDGTHLVLDGLDRWYELSLVSLGAAKNAKIVGRTRQILGKDEYNRLAASGRDPELLTLFASPTKQRIATMAEPNNQEVGLALVASLSAEKATAQLALEAASVKVAALEAGLIEANDRVKALEVQLAEVAEAAKFKDDHEKVMTFLSEQTRAAMVAAGIENPQVPETVEGMLASISESQLKLHNLPKGPVGEPAGADNVGEQTTAPARFAAFKVKK